MRGNEVHPLIRVLMRPGIFLDRPEGYLVSDFQVAGLGWVGSPGLYFKVRRARREA